MRILFLFNFILFGLSVLGQDLPFNPFQKYIDISSFDVKISPVSKMKLLHTLVSNKYVYSHDLDSIDASEFDNYHIVDYNSDGKLDAIYDGRNPCGIETNNVIFFINVQDSLHPVIKLNGDFISLKIYNGRLHSFQLIKRPCCAEYTFTVEKYIYKSSKECFKPEKEKYGNDFSYQEFNSSQFCVKLVNQYVFAKKTQIPTSSNHIDTLFSKETCYFTVLPSKPSSVDFSELGSSFITSRNKAIASIPKGVRCYVSAEATDNTGEVYCFVKLQNARKERNYFGGLTCFQFGWIKKSQLI